MLVAFMSKASKPGYFPFNILSFLKSFMPLHIKMYWYWDQNPSTVWLRVHLRPGYRWLDTPPEGLSARPLLCKQLHPLYLACRRLTLGPKVRSRGPGVMAVCDYCIL